MLSPMIFQAGHVEAIDFSPQELLNLPSSARGPFACHWFPVAGVRVNIAGATSDPGYGADPFLLSLLAGRTRVGSNVVQAAFGAGAYGSASSGSAFGVRGATAAAFAFTGVRFEVFPTPAADGQGVEISYQLETHYLACDPPSREYGRARAPRGFR
jgi:hypothetical protein